jgi:hypothetical protein
MDLEQLRSWNNLVGQMIGIRPRWTWLRIPVEAKNYQQIVQTGSEAHTTSC